jgi:hypothetical protein
MSQQLSRPQNRRVALLSSRSRSLSRTLSRACLGSIIRSPLNGNVKMSPHETRGTFTLLSQKELQRVTVISQCVQGNLTCARAAELLDFCGHFEPSDDPRLQEA